MRNTGGQPAPERGGAASTVPGPVRTLAAWRRWPTSVKIVALVALPVLIAGATGGVLVATTMSTVRGAYADERIVQAENSVLKLLGSVQAERELGSGTANTPADQGQLADARSEVDTAAAQFSAAMAAVGESGEPRRAAEAQLARINDVRAVPGPVQLVTAYSDLTGALLDVSSTLVRRADDRELSADLLGTLDLARAHEYLARQQSFVELGLGGAPVAGPDLAAAREATTLGASWLDQFTAIAPDSALRAYRETVPADDKAARDALAARVLNPGAAFVPAVPAAQWRDAGRVVDRLDVLTGQFSAADIGLASRKADDAAARNRTLVIALAAAGVVAAMLVLVIGGYLHRTVSSLRRSAVEIAETGLPAKLRRAREGHPETAPSLPPSHDGEFGALAKAFDSVCAEAISAAAEHAKMRAGYSEVFENVFMRSQSLMLRQLRLIENLEKDEPAPDRLELLYRLDHLVTRMRRNNENILVLSGNEPVRKPGKPATVETVFHAATSEIEQYQRVEALDAPKAKIIDTAAQDLTRMLAELLDNATSFSAPETTVTVQGQILRDGSLSIAVVDSGIGMSDEELEHANQRLTRLGSADLADSRRVGLVVVGRLAGRHGIGVELLGGDQASGVTAVLSVPADLVLEAERPGWADRRHAMQAASSRRARQNPPAATGGAANGQLAPVRRLVEVGARQEKTAERAAPAPLDEQTRQQLVESSHADVPEELPVRTPNRVIGRSGAVTAKTAEQRAASGWFKARNTATQPRAVSRSTVADGSRENWPSQADEGWIIVETVARSDKYTYTDDGLPIRRRGAQLLPGSAAGRPVQSTERDPARARSRLSSFQQGIRKARGDDGKRPRKPGGWGKLRKSDSDQ
ncbi:sensor histidine kinase [Amycolatopsis pithecellobii]|nr:nitrate- and nitrite sensing domain-containing protein [Amycolatopsis pithecellobii]